QREIAIVIAGSEHDAARLGDVLVELLARFDVVPHIGRRDVLDLKDVIAPTEASRELVARAWFDFRAKDVAKLYLVDGRSERVLVRSVAIHRGHEEVAREELGHI